MNPNPKHPNGGARKGAGRKTIKAELLRHDIQTDGLEDAKYAYSLFVSKMHGVRITRERLAAAKEVMDRVLGRPQQRIAGSWEGGILPIQMVEVDYRKGLDEQTDTSETSARSVGDSDTPS